MHFVKIGGTNTVNKLEIGGFKIEGGEYILPATKPFLRAASTGTGTATVELKGVVINGKTYNETVTLNSSGATWIAQ